MATQNVSDLKSLFTVPIIIISCLFIFNILTFLFWIVEDVTDRDYEALKRSAYFLSQLIEKEGLKSASDFSDFQQRHIIEINSDALILQVKVADSLVYQSHKIEDIDRYEMLYEEGNLYWFYDDSGFFNQATYVIPYSFKRHTTIAWISAILLLSSIWFSRRWILRNRELNRQYHLNEEWSNIGRITRGLLHEVRNPLNAISVNTQLLEEDIVSSPLEEKEKNAAVSTLWSIQKEVEHMDSLLQEFNDYSKRRDLNFLRVNVNLILESAVDFYRGECEKANISIQTRLNPDLAKIKGDSKELKRVFYNLISNAIQAMPNGGSLKISTFKRMDKILINISDSGVGINADKGEDIFDEFYSTKEKGTGLGLAISKRIIENHNGRISFQSNRKEGTTFTISLARRIF